VSSPLSRAAETANLIAAGLGLSVDRRVPELAERSFGPAEGLQAGPELDALRIPGGGFRGAESEDEAAFRGWPRWKRWPRSSAAAASWSSPTARSSV
jgi:probable phosphoglycerate mutase